MYLCFFANHILTCCILSKIQDSLRYFIEIAYNGKNYHGWQKQPNDVTVQEVFEKTLSTLLREDIKITGSGRTDAGVHAKQLFVHFDSLKKIDETELIFKLNSLLPKDISTLNVFQVKDEAHARFDAVEREYEYVISLKKNPFYEDFSYLLHQVPDITLMNEAAKVLLDYNDFQCFSRSKTDVKTYHCTIKEAYWRVEESQFIFSIKADRFLRNMVRAIVGSLLDVGLKITSLEQFHDIIKSKDRSKAGTSAPAKGLILTKVKYPKNIQNKVPLD